MKIKSLKAIGKNQAFYRASLNVRAAQGVVLSCGGYEYDEESKRNFNLGDPILTLGCPGNTGDGLRMAEAAGAGIWHTSGLSCPLGTKVPGHTASQAFNTKQTGYILVDQNGKRFINEKQIEHHAGILAVNYFDSYEMKYPRIPCYAIFDANSKEDGAFAPSYGSGWLRHREKWNWSRSNDKEIEAGIVKVGQNIQELAEKIGVDAKNLQATIGQWNSDLKGPEKKTLCLDVRLKVTSAKYGRTAQARNNLLL
ncbi:MAG: FAD-binding protein [Parasutterella sp.]